MFDLACKQHSICPVMRLDVGVRAGPGGVLQDLRMMKFMDVFGRQESSGLSQSEAAELLGVGERTFRRQGYMGTKAFLQGRGLLSLAPRRGAHRRKRPRRPLPGMMLHQDASRHEWVAGLPACDLIVMLDDATSAILVAEEGTASSFAGLLEVFAVHGMPCSLHTDRGSHCFFTPKAGGPVDRGTPTQVGRALAQLGVEHIAAYSPQARGRSERAFRTLQDRLPKELALAGAVTVAGANAHLRDAYVAAYNGQFAVAAEQEGTAFTAVPADTLREVLCHQEERQVGLDNTVVLDRVRLQIPPGPLRAHHVRATVKVRRHSDASHAVFHGPRCIGRYDAHGALLDVTGVQPGAGRPVDAPRKQKAA